MATKYFCDRCGDEVESYAKLKVLSLCYVINVNNSQDFQPLPSAISEQLCQECIEFVQDEFTGAVSKGSIHRQPKQL